MPRYSESHCQRFSVCHSIHLVSENHHNIIALFRCIHLREHNLYLNNIYSHRTGSSIMSESSLYWRLIQAQTRFATISKHLISQTVVNLFHILSPIVFELFRFFSIRVCSLFICVFSVCLSAVVTDSIINVIITSRCRNSVSIGIYVYIQ